MMQKRWNNLVGRGLLLLMLALFAVPCLACEDAVGRMLDHEPHHAASVIHAAATGCGCATCETPHRQALPCSCLSDATKVRADVSLAVPIIPASVLPPVFLPLPEESPIRVTSVEPDRPVSRILAHPAVADRAPPVL